VVIIGDTHGNMAPLHECAARGQTMIHIGDLGFRRHWLEADQIPDLHVVAGNHDDVLTARNTRPFLGDFGDLAERLPGISGVFFVRGAFSIDRDMRIQGRDWWPEEELSDERLREAGEFYAAMRPRVVISHEAPLVVNHVLYGAETISSRTALALFRMLQIHEPKRWYFGHHHVSWERQLGGTTFRALGIDEILDVEF
jgi:predicted phosphodiesterase